MECPKCRGDNRDDSKFCSNCAAPFGPGARAGLMNEHNPFINCWLAMSLSYAQRTGESRELFELIEREAAGTVWASFASFHKHAQARNRSEALHAATADFRSMAKDDELFSLWIAEGYALLGESGEAIAWLESAAKSGFISYPFLMEYDPFLASIRGDERFLKLMEWVKNEWQRFEV